MLRARSTRPLAALVLLQHVSLVRALAGGRRSRRRAPRPPRPPKVLRRLDGGVPKIAQVYPERYDALLREKLDKLEAQLRSAVSYAPLPATEVFESARTGFRMRAAFQVWREGEDPDEQRHLVMYERESPDPHVCEAFPMGSKRINAMMPDVLKAIQAPALGKKIIDARFLTTQTDEALLCLCYNRDLGGATVDGVEYPTDAWEAAARDLSEKLGATVVGRSRKLKLVVGADDDLVGERLVVPGRGVCEYAQQEGAFTQPNAGVCEQMLGWAYDATKGSEGDLCELYCGGGTFTVALAPNFRRVFATELSKASVALAGRNLEKNGVANVRVARCPAEEVAAALETKRLPRKLVDAGVALDEFDALSTLFVDPPRAGLDATCSALAAGFDRVVYVSCNPETLARDVRLLSATHAVTRLAAFDQFPYTDHLECGVVLEKR